MSTTDPDTTAAKQNFCDEAMAADKNEMMQAMTILWTVEGVSALHSSDRTSFS
jgi:hypothetical protein